MLSLNIPITYNSASTADPSLFFLKLIVSYIIVI